MPQASDCNKSSDVPYGHGSLYNHLREARDRTLRRTVKVNRGMEKKLETYQTLITKHQQAEKARKEKVLNRLYNSIVELEAYKRVVEKMRAKDFDMLQFGFHPRQIQTPRSFQRYKTERRVINTGFSIQTLYPQVLQVIEESDPERIREEERLKVLEHSKKLSSFSIDRRITDAAKHREELLKEISSLDQIPVQEIGKMDKMNKTVKPLPPIRVQSEQSKEFSKHGDVFSSRSTPAALKLKPVIVRKDQLK